MVWTKQQTWSFGMQNMFSLNSCVSADSVGPVFLFNGNDRISLVGQNRTLELQEHLTAFLVPQSSTFLGNKLDNPESPKVFEGCVVEFGAFSLHFTQLRLHCFHLAHEPLVVPFSISLPVFRAAKTLQNDLCFPFFVVANFRLWR